MQSLTIVPVRVFHTHLWLDEDFELSDEEVLTVSEDASDSEVEHEDGEEIKAVSERKKLLKSTSGRGKPDSEASATPEEDEDSGGWGASKNDYYNADAIETEADALEEEAEARRLQRKQLQGLTDADFGFDENEWLKADKDRGDEDGSDGDNVVRKVLPKLEITDAIGPEERLKIMRTRYPEFEPLATEFISLQTVHENLKTASLAATMAQKNFGSRNGRSTLNENLITPIAVVKYNALSAYLAVLSMYFALLTSGKAGSDGKLSAMPSEELHDHTVMETLVQCRDTWEKTKDMAVPEANGASSNGVQMPNGHHADQIIHEAADPTDHVNNQTEHAIGIKQRKHRKSKAQKAAEAAQIEADARRAERLRQTEEELATLAALTAPSKLTSKAGKRHTKPASPDEGSDSDFGEQTTLTVHEAAEKAKRKKSLRFYTSQIAQKSNKRDAAGRDAGGDADLPYRERLKDRQARLNAEAEKRGKKPKESVKGQPLGGPSDEEDHAVARDLREDSGSEDYYDLIASRAAEKKASKAALAAAHAQAEKEGGIVRIVDEEGSGGKRAISYAIEKNKGLAPRRAKLVRNPRVKKRKSYEAKKKKLGSVKQIYKGGEGRGGYGGEQTGIKKGLVKSVKL